MKKNQLAWISLSAFLLGALFVGSAPAQSLVFSNLWSIPTGERDYLTTTANERGLAINPVTRHVLLVSRSGGLNVVALDAADGQEVGRLDTAGISGGTFALSLIGVADDGVIYAANLVTSMSDTAWFKIYRWADESASPTVAFEGNVSAGMRLGDSLAVRGAGTHTQIAAGASGTATGVRFAIFTTTDGENFTATPFSPSGVAAGNLQKGIAFGAGDTVFGKINSSPARYLDFNLTTATANLINTLSVLDSSISPLDVELQLKLLAGINYNTHQLLVYDINDLNAPLPVRSFPFPAPATANGNGIGAVDFAAGMLVGLDTQNGVLAYSVSVSTAAAPPAILNQSASQTILAGGRFTFSVAVSGTQPFGYQWFLNNAAIAGATNPTYPIAQAQASDAGAYRVVVTNAVGSASSTNATLTVTPLVQQGYLSSLWTLQPGDRPYLANDNMQRGLAFNPLTTNVLLVSRTLGETNIYVIDGNTGADKYRLSSLDSAGQNVIAGGTYALNLVGVADNGVVYACNLTTGGAGFTIYRWADDGTNTLPSVAYVGDPGIARIGDNFDVRGSGPDTQLLAGSRFGTNAVVFTTTDGQNFTPTIIEVADATAGNFGLGIAFGEGNTFWGKSSGQPLRQVSFDLTAGLGTTLAVFAATNFPFGPISVHPGRSWLAGIALDTPDNLRLYDFKDASRAPVLMDQQLFPTDNDNLNGTGAVDFGGDRLYALDSNNEILAFKVGSAPAAQPVLSSPQIAGGKFTFLLTGETGRTYLTEASEDLKAWAPAATNLAAATQVRIEIPAPGSRSYYRARVQP